MNGVRVVQTTVALLKVAPMRRETFERPGMPDEIDAEPLVVAVKVKTKLLLGEQHGWTRVPEPAVAVMLTDESNEKMVVVARLGTREHWIKSPTRMSVALHEREDVASGVSVRVSPTRPSCVLGSSATERFV